MLTKNRFWLIQSSMNGFTVGLFTILLLALPGCVKEKDELVFSRSGSGSTKRDCIWTVFPQEGGEITSFFLDPSGQNGYAFDDYGLVYRCKNSRWSISMRDGIKTKYAVTSSWRSDDGTHGWAMSQPNEILRFDSRHGWRKDRFSSGVSGLGYHDLWMSKDGQTGWAVGEEGWSIYLDSNGEWRKAEKANRLSPVSYTHLTLPTIYSV